MSRLLNRQRQLGEQGRLRFGQMITGTRKNGSAYTRPVSTLTWIVTSHSREHVQSAAELWGGTAERWKPQGHGAEQWRVITDTSVIEAILPPGDPLFQAYELWSGGGCQRRCNGEVEELSGSPCICRAQFGDVYHEQKQGTVCDDKTRLKVIIPDMPGIGSWRMETGSYFAADEIAGFVDLIRGVVGDQILVPIKLALIQDTKTRDGETKQFVRPKVDLRGITAGELLSGAPSLTAVASSRQVAAMQAGPAQGAVAASTRTAIEAGTQAGAGQSPDRPAPAAEDFIGAAEGSASLDNLSTNLQAAQHAGFARDLQDPEDPVAAAFIRRRDQLMNPAPAAVAPPPPAPAGDAPDADLLWMQIVQLSPWPMSELEDRFAKAMGGIVHSAADEAELDSFLRRLKAGELTQPAAADGPGF